LGSIGADWADCRGGLGELQRQARAASLRCHSAAVPIYKMGRCNRPLHAIRPVPVCIMGAHVAPIPSWNDRLIM